LGIEEYEVPNWLHRPFPCVIVGEYIADRFQLFVEELKCRGFDVSTRTRSGACQVELCDEGYAVLLDNGDMVHTKELFVATGHFQSPGRFAPDGHPGFFDSPFPPQRLQNEIDLGVDVGILGCSLSAIDAALTLCAKNCHFEEVSTSGGPLQGFYQGSHTSFGYLNGGYLRFVPFDGTSSFNLTMYARQGLLPQVMGVVVNKIFSYRYLTPENFIPIIESNDGFLSFGRILEAVEARTRRGDSRLAQAFLADLGKRHAGRCCI